MASQVLTVKQQRADALRRSRVEEESDVNLPPPQHKHSEDRAEGKLLDRSYKLSRLPYIFLKDVALLEVLYNYLIHFHAFSLVYIQRILSLILNI